MKKDNEEELYNAIIIALILGIIVVLVTLFLTKPEPESFTELYFNDHTNLPEFVTTNQSYNYSFTIANHENKKLNYNYSIIEQLYEYDYSCERPEIYLEEKTNSSFEKYTSSKYKTPTRITNTEDPRLIIKEENYTSSLNYRTKSGEGQIVIIFEGIDKKQKYAVIINEEKQTASLILGAKKLNQDILIEKRIPHNIRLEAGSAQLKVFIDGNLTFNITKFNDYTKGFLQLETTKTYADISSLVIERRNQRQGVSVRYGDVKYDEIELEKINSLTTSESVYQTEDKDFERIIVPLNYTRQQQEIFTAKYEPQERLNLSTYTLEASFKLRRNRQISLGVRDLFDINLNQSERRIHITNNAGTQSFNITRKDTFTISADVYGDTLTVYLDGKLVASTTLITSSSGRPYLETDDEAMLINRFEARSNEYPLIIQYNAPEENAQTISYADVDKDIVDMYKDLKQNSSSVNISEDTKQLLEDEMEGAKIKWDNYTITVTYIDQGRNGSVSLTLNNLTRDLLKITMNDLSNVITTTFYSNGKKVALMNESLLSKSSIHQIIIDVSGKNMTIIIDGKMIYDANADLGEGILLLDETKGIIYQRVQAENSDKNEIKLIRVGRGITCKTILKAEYKYEDSVMIPDNQLKSFRSNFNLTQEFDTAKVTVNIKDTQSIHFMVKRI